MTPAVNAVKKAKVGFSLHEYTHDPSQVSYGMEAAEKLAVSPAQVFKTLVAKLDNQQLAVAILPVNTQLSMKCLAKACGAKKSEMADVNEVQRATGYVLGGVSPLGQKKRLITVIDQSAQAHTTIYVSAGRRGLELELPPLDLQGLTQASFAAISQI